MSSRSRTASALVAAILALALAAVLASAQEAPSELEPVQEIIQDQEVVKTLAEPGPALQEQGVPADTDYTPIAKESELWSLVQGARYDGSGPESGEAYEARAALVAGSASEQVTSFDDDLTDVHFGVDPVDVDSQAAGVSWSS